MHEIPLGQEVSVHDHPKFLLKMCTRACIHNYVCVKGAHVCVCHRCMYMCVLQVHYGRMCVRAYVIGACGVCITAAW